MAVNIEDKIEKLGAAQREKVESRAAEQLAEEMTLRDLRKARKHTGPLGEAAQDHTGQRLEAGEAQRSVAFHTAEHG